MNFSVIKDWNIDLKVVESHFVMAVVGVADEKQVAPTDVSLIVCITQGTGVFNKGKEVVRAIKYSNSEAFEEETVKISKLTKADMTGAISSALKEILLGEIQMHNATLHLPDFIVDEDGNKLPNPHKRESARKYGQPIDKKLELWISVDAEDNLIMNMIYGNNKLRSYSIREEFKEVDNVKIGEVVNEDEIDEAQAQIQRSQNG